MASPLPFPALPLEVTVPGSTSNLGSGFDLLGLALSLTLRVRLVGPVETAGRGHLLARRGGYASRWPGDDDDLLFRAFRRAGGDVAASTSFAFEVDSDLPLERGFGSSGAAVAAGLLLGAAVAAEEPSSTDLLRWGIEIEGHPDNIAASLHGGCTLCHPDAGPGGEPVLIANALDPAIGFVVAWPSSPLSTARARAVLPARIPFADAVENPRRLALLLEGLRRGDPSLLAAGGVDRLHTEHRLPLIPGGRDAMDAGQRAGAWLTAISGAGSGLVALGPRDACPGIAEAMRAAFTAAGEEGTACVVEPVRGAPRVHSLA